MTKPLSDSQIRSLLRDYYNNPSSVAGGGQDTSPRPAAVSSHIPLRYLTGIAAGIALFAAGVGLGGRLARTPAAETNLTPSDQQLIGLEIQRAGSEYIRALAALNAEDGTQPALRDEARQIAVETLIGATREMIDLLHGESQVVQLFSTASALRAPDPEQSSPMAFPVRF